MISTRSSTASCSIAMTGITSLPTCREYPRLSMDRFLLCRFREITPLRGNGAEGSVQKKMHCRPSSVSASFVISILCPVRKSLSVSGMSIPGPGCGTLAAFWSFMFTKPAWIQVFLTTLSAVPSFAGMKFLATPVSSTRSMSWLPEV